MYLDNVASLHPPPFQDTADRLREVALGVGWYLRAFFASLPVAVFPESAQVRASRAGFSQPRVVIPLLI